MQVDKKRMPRREPEEHVIVHEDENAHLWAVSYSDFLMALLSFFILFFSVDTPQQQKIILNLASTFSNADGKGGGPGSGSRPGNGGPGVGESATAATRVPANVMDQLKSLNVQVAPDKESLVVNFPDSFFGPGQHDVSPDHVSLLKTFLKAVVPHRDQLNLYFEGHADQTPLQKAKNGIVVDNFVLSSLRGSSALRVARDMGFSEKNLFVQAASSNIRNSRSLSIRIEPKEGRVK